MEVNDLYEEFSNGSTLITLVELLTKDKLVCCVCAFVHAFVDMMCMCVGTFVHLVCVCICLSLSVYMCLSSVHVCMSH